MNEEVKEIKPPVYTEEEAKYRASLITKLCEARDEREKPHTEFDDMPYSLYYETNRKADLSYIPPKKNKDDKRIVTGITRNKDTNLLSTLLSYNFEPNITAYDDEEIIYAELGNHAEDIVKKSRELEQYEIKRQTIYRELISQGNIFVEEIWEDVFKPEFSNTNSWKVGAKIKDAKFEKKLTGKRFSRSAVKKHSGLNVYLGNFHEEIHENQPFIFTYEEIDRSLAENIYGKWDRWENVPKSVENIDPLLVDNMQKEWSLGKVNENKVGVLKYQNPHTNNYMVMLNGVMVLPINFPLSEISQTGGYTIHNIAFEQIPNCAYGKGQPANTKVDQAVHDEFLKLLILGEEQARTPPMGTRAKKVFSSDIFSPAKITYNIKDGDLFPLLPQATALSNADFSMYQLIKENIESKTINATFSGEAPQRQTTAFQLNQEKQQQLLKLGVSFDSIKNLEKTLVWARIMNEIIHSASPKKVKEGLDGKAEKIYRKFAVETTLADGRSGIKIFEWTDKSLPDIGSIKKEEDNLSEEYGKPVQKVYFNACRFLELLKYRWVVNIVATQEGNDELNRQMFSEKVAEAKQLFPNRVNDEYVMERYAIHIKEDPERFFLKQDEIDQLALQAGIDPNNMGGRSMPALENNQNTNV